MADSGLNSASPFFLQWHLHSLRQNGLIDSRASTRCRDAWELLGRQVDPGIVIGINDDGIDLEHPGLRDASGMSLCREWAYWHGSRLYTSRSPRGRQECMNQPYAVHGTGCAGLVAAPGREGSASGAAPGCSLLPVKWESAEGRLLFSDSRFLRILDYVSTRVDILLNPWSPAPEREWSPRVIEAITSLAASGGRRGKGILFLFAAGNENCPLNSVSANSYARRPYPLIGPGGKIGWRSHFRQSLCGTPGVLYVGAVSSLARRSHYSNYGQGLDLCSPSNNFHTFGQHSLIFFGPWRIRGLELTTITLPGRTGWSLCGGTSAAAALVAGVAALVLTANPLLSAEALARILKETANKDLDMSGYPVDPASPLDPPLAAPYADGQFDARGWSPWYGFGRVDALDAVKRALILQGQDNPE